MKNVLGLVILLTVCDLAQSAPPPGGADRASILIDEFLAESSWQNAAYRADLRPAQSATQAGPGRRFAVGPLAGPFSYRPKTYRELTPDERAALWQDESFIAFLHKSLARVGPGQFVSSSRTRPLRVELPPAELLRARPGSIALPEP